MRHPPVQRSGRGDPVTSSSASSSSSVADQTDGHSSEEPEFAPAAPAASTAGPPVPVELSPAQPGAAMGAAVPEQVSNNKHKRRHAILVGPPCLDPGAWITGCGWRFGRSVWAGAVNPAHMACTRCARKVGPGFH